jgi:EpsI family protein
MTFVLRSFLLLALMLAAAGMAVALRPTHKMADQGTKLNLEAMIPKSFGDWRIDESIVPIAPSPEVQAEVERSYDQTLSRTYLNSKGHRVMLSIAYGGDYSKRVMQYHRPEVCYPSQGFEILSRDTGTLELAQGKIPIVRLYAKNGTRHEPVTYWITVANQATRYGLELRWIQIKSRLTGQLPDGLLVRFSSISLDTANAYATHDAFSKEMLNAMQPSDAVLLAGKLNP